MKMMKSTKSFSMKLPMRWQVLVLGTARSGKRLRKKLAMTANAPTMAAQPMN